MGQSFTPYQRRDYPAGDAPFRQAETLGPVPYAHDQLDEIRMYWRRTPEAQYPDGYLGNINPRRGDRLLDGLKRRQTNRPYTRGVHKGERIDPIDYAWPPEFNLWSGLEHQAAGVRFSPPGLGEDLEYERTPTDGRSRVRNVPVGPRGPVSHGRTPEDPGRLATLRSQAPAWSTGRGNPGMAVPYPGR